MSICDRCKKHPLEYGEINDISDEKGRKKTLCDKCFKTYWHIKGGR